MSNDWKDYFIAVVLAVVIYAIGYGTAWMVVSDRCEDANQVERGCSESSEVEVSYYCKHSDGRFVYVDSTWTSPEGHVPDVFLNSCHCIEGTIYCYRYTGECD